ncbi:hypothetical protein [Salisediminibacterium beveridgei]|uniref:hypothetical protein n=1 Tax=Salisediminibacterium beveridgei TaxID=632773 RepID=UPI000847F4AD|nr:hypothetical protein [Salisediminibacterium beveridgei]
MRKTMYSLLTLVVLALVASPGFAGAEEVKEVKEVKEVALVKGDEVFIEGEVGTEAWWKVVAVYIGAIYMGDIVKNGVDTAFEYATGRTPGEWGSTGVTEVLSYYNSMGGTWDNVNININPDTQVITRSCVSYPCPIVPVSVPEEDVK